MGVFQDVYMQEGISMDITLLKKMIEKSKDMGAGAQYILGLEDALKAIIHQKETFPWD